MAISFGKLKDPKLGLTDKLTFGKLNGCRICDVAQDHYEYLIWAERQGYVKYQQEVIDLIHEQASFAKWKIYQEEEVDPYMEPHFPVLFEEDIPF